MSTLVLVCVYPGPCPVTSVSTLVVVTSVSTLVSSRLCLPWGVVTSVSTLVLYPGATLVLVSTLVSLLCCPPSLFSVLSSGSLTARSVAWQLVIS